MRHTMLLLLAVPAWSQVTVTISSMGRDAVRTTYGRTAARSVGAVTAAVRNIGQTPALIEYEWLGAVAAADPGLSIYSLARTRLMLGEAHRRSWPEIAARVGLLDLPVIPAMLNAAGSIAIPPAALTALLAAMAFGPHVGERLKQVEPAVLANLEALQWRARVLQPGGAALAEVYCSPSSKPTVGTITIPADQLPHGDVAKLVSLIMERGFNDRQAADNLLALQGR